MLRLNQFILNLLVLDIYCHGVLLFVFTIDLNKNSRQVWLDGELVGGLDILKEMHENGELVTTLPVKQSLNTRLKNIINSHKVRQAKSCYSS